MYYIIFESWACEVGSFATRVEAESWLTSIHPERAIDGIIIQLDNPANTKALWEEWDKEIEDEN